MPLAGATPPLNIATEKVCQVVVLARRYDVKEADSDPDEGSNPTDDGAVDVLEDTADDPVATELKQFIDDLDYDEQVDLVALAWLGRDSGTLDDWATLRGEAADAHNDRTTEYLLGIPLLADFLEDALSTFGRSCLDFESDHL